jgi:hypothetical protein
VRPRVVGVDGPRERAELVRKRCEARAIGTVHPWEAVADMAAVGEHPGVLTRELGKGRDDREAELLGETQVRLVKRAHHLAAELHDASIGQGRLLDAAAGAVPRLQHQDVRARVHQIACGAQAGQSGAHDNHVAFHGGILS